MKITRKKLLRLIESALYEQDTKGAATFGLLTGAGFVGTMQAMGAAAGPAGASALTSMLGTIPGIQFSVAQASYMFGLPGGTKPPAAALRALFQGMASDGTVFNFGTRSFTASVAANAALVGAAGFAGYQLGSYIQDKMSGKDSSGPEEKLAVSIKRHAKDMIGELGALGGLLPTWDTVSDEEYAAKAKKKKFKGLKPHEIDKGRLEELMGIILTGRCFTEDGKIPKAIDELFAFPYLDAYEFKRIIKKREARLIDNMVSEVDEDGEPVGPEKVNESLSRGSLYRRRYHGRY